jgi:hypothetical protein
MHMAIVSIVSNVPQFQYLFDDKIVQLFVLLFACKDGLKLIPRWYVIESY